MRHAEDSQAFGGHLTLDGEPGDDADAEPAFHGARDVPDAWRDFIERNAAYYRR